METIQIFKLRPKLYEHCANLVSKLLMPEPKNCILNKTFQITKTLKLQLQTHYQPPICFVYHPPNILAIFILDYCERTAKKGDQRFFLLIV